MNARGAVPSACWRTDYGEIDFAGLQQLDQIGHDVFDQPQVHIGILVDEISEPRREEIRRDCGDTTDGEPPRHAEAERDGAIPSCTAAFVKLPLRATAQK